MSIEATSLCELEVIQPRGLIKNHKEGAYASFKVDRFEVDCPTSQGLSYFTSGLLKYLSSPQCPQHSPRAPVIWLYRVAKNAVELSCIHTLEFDLLFVSGPLDPTHLFGPLSHSVCVMSHNACKIPLFC